MVDKNLNKIPTEIKRSEYGKFEEPLIDHRNNFSPVLAVQRLVSKFNAYKFMEFIKPQELYYSYDAVKNEVIATMVYNEIPYENASGPALWVWNSINPYNANILEYEYVNTTLNFILKGEEISEAGENTNLITMRNINSIKNHIILPKDIKNIPDCVKVIYIRPNLGEIQFVVDKDMDLSDPFDLHIYKIRKKA